MFHAHYSELYVQNTSRNKKVQKSVSFEVKDCLRAIYRIVKQRIISDHRRVSSGFRTLPGGDDSKFTKEGSAEAGS